MTEAVPAKSAATPTGNAPLAATVSDYQSALLRYAAALLRGHSEAAQDVVQEVFIRFHQAQCNGQQIRNPSSWLYRVTHNLAIDVQRREKRYQHGKHIEATIEQAEPVPPGTEATCHREACRLAVTELADLPDEQQRVLLLKVVQQLTLKEVGEIMDLPLSTVHYHLGQGLRELARRLTSKGAI